MKISKKKAQGVGDRLGVDWSRIDLEQFRRGMEVEQEHWGTVNGDIDMVAKIAWDHLRELPDYYTRLDRMELEAAQDSYGKSEPETCHVCRRTVLSHEWDTSYIDRWPRCPHCKVPSPKSNPTPTHGRRSHNRYVFLTDCVGWRNGDDINEMKRESMSITRRQFLAKVDIEQMREKEAELGYERSARRGLTMAKDWSVGYFQSKFVGVPTVYFSWSGIEYIFVDPSHSSFAALR